MHQQAVFRRYRFNSATNTYAGVKKPRRGKGLIVTAGLTTTVTSATRAFQDAIGGDEIRVKVAGITYRRVIVTRTSEASVVVDVSVNIPTARTWQHTPQRAGITEADGWIGVQHFREKQLFIQLETKGSGTGITYSVEAKGDENNSIPRQIMTGTLTAAVVSGTTDPLAADIVTITERVVAIRVGVKNDAGGTDIVSCWVTGETHR